MFKRLALALALISTSATAALAFETQARAAWVYDMTTGTVLMDVNAQTPMPPASMSKLMTLNMLFEKLRQGGDDFNKSTTMSVSEKAWKMEGSRMFVEPADKPTVDELIHGIIINSGNDACVVVAENLGGSEESFAAKMSARAAELGMTHSHFANSSGMPDPGHKMSAEDLGLLAVRLISEFPEYYPYFALTDYNYKNRVPSNSRNRNPLLQIKGGNWKADGLKTGHTQEAGYGLVGSAVHDNGRRIVFVIMGLPSEKARAEESERIASWAFREFAMKTLAKAGTRVAEADVFMGDAAKVGLVPAADVAKLLPTEAFGRMSAEVVYTGPLKAPITKGDTLAELVVHVPGLPDARIPLVAETDVGSANVLQRLSTAAHVLFARFFAPQPTAS